MRLFHSLRTAALASLCLPPLAALADDAPPDNNAIWAGVRGQSQSSPLFGRYNGFDNSGAQFLGGFLFTGGDAWNSGGTDWYRVEGLNLDYTSHRFAPEGWLSAQYGNRHFSVEGFYNAITYTGQQFYSAFTTPANGILGLEPGFTAFGGAGAAKAGAITAVNASGAANAVNPFGKLVQEQAGTRRDIIGADTKFNFGSWIVTSGLQNEHKSGTLEETMDQSTSGLAFQLPVDYDTTRFFVQAAFNSPTLQAIFAYNLSKFWDSIPSVQAPFFISETAIQPGYPTLYQATSAYSNAPSNLANYFNGSVAYNLDATTRVMANGRVGVEEQIGGTISPASVVAWTPGSPYANELARDPSRSGAATAYGVNLVATARPMTDLNMRVSYALDGREAGYSTNITGGANGTGTAVPSATSFNNYSLGQQWTKQKALVEAAYRLWQTTRLTIAYSLERMDRDLSEVSHSATSTFSVKLASTPFRDLTASVGYDHSNRNGSVQYALVPLTSSATVSPAVASLVANDYGIASLAIPWYQAAMSGDTISLRSDYRAADQVGVGVNGKLAVHDYHYPVGLVGQNRDYTGSVGPDLSYRPFPDLVTHFFYSYEEIYHGDQAASAAYALNNDYGASIATTNHIQTVGASMDWKITDRLKVKSAYTFSSGSLSYAMFDGLTTANTGWTTSPEVNLQNPPNVNTTMHALKLTGDYDIAPNMTLTVGYAYDMFKDNDWAYNTYPAIFLNSLTAGGLQVSSGETNPSYRVQSVFTSVRVTF